MHIYVHCVNVFGLIRIYGMQWTKHDTFCTYIVACQAHPALGVVLRSI